MESEKVSKVSPKFMQDTIAAQKNLTVPDILRNSRSVDEALWKGSRSVPLIQRAGTFIIGLLLIICGISSAMTATKNHYLFEIVLTIAFISAGLKVASNGLLRSNRRR